MASEDKEKEGVEEGNDDMERKTSNNEEGDDGGRAGFRRHPSETSFNATDQDDECDDGSHEMQLGHQCNLKEQLEKDKDDESLRKWKERFLGSVDFETIGETLDPEVKFLQLSIISPGRLDIVLSIPEDGKPKASWFTLKEGCQYNLTFSFKVGNNIVSGLKYTKNVWKTGVKVHNAKEMIGTFSPEPDPYTHVMPEELTPSGLFARGSYTAKTRFVDDDNKCHLEINYTFDIRKEWVAS
ncbi:hypothetical protein K2173_001732 [Erythroxylum novogranatense]|uniref:Rho GDP-dissociation inhibitor 1 n=1 Tax=Erythroxylum novogranatense TaxID=1862640 RepID=A0AAV8S8F1_9ROSI|nr:hypothetical protein K2173_001732 [Erythroxylum novogranatense]